MLAPALLESPDGRVMEKRFNKELNQSSTSCHSKIMILSYAEWISNYTVVLQERRPKSRLAKLRESGLMGCLNNSDVTSKNYKDIVFNESKKN